MDFSHSLESQPSFQPRQRLHAQTFAHFMRKTLRTYLVDKIKNMVPKRRAGFQPARRTGMSALLFRPPLPFPLVTKLRGGGARDKWRQENERAQLRNALVPEDVPRPRGQRWREYCRQSVKQSFKDNCVTRLEPSNEGGRC